MLTGGDEQQKAWDDPFWREKRDGPWRAGLRLQQAWWRHEVLRLPPGPLRKSGGRPVVSMLPLGVGLDRNLISPESALAAESAMEQLRERKAPGIIQEDRLTRNLLSSQPMCFNIFGHLSASPEALLPWARTLVPDAVGVSDVRLEWAPVTGTLGGSAFDAFVDLELSGGNRGFLGVECKYAENLTDSQRSPAKQKYLAATRSPQWKAGAGDSLDKHGLRQFWYKQLLAHTVAANDGYSVGLGVVMACSADTRAREAADTVKAQLVDRDAMVFSALEDLVCSVEGHDQWRARVWQRYFDFSPIREHLPATDPRRETQHLVD